MDLSTLSDDDLAKLRDQVAATPSPKAPGPDLSRMSDQDLLALRDHVANQPNPHDIVPFLKNTASGLWEGIKGAAGGVADAVRHPLDTAKEAGNWMLENGGPGGREDTLVGERSMRSLPGAGPMYDNARALADPNYLANQAKEDAQHAKEHPTLDKAQKLLGNSAGMAVGGLPGAGLYIVDAYHRSRLAGNDADTAMKDARNVGLLLGGTAAASKGLGMAADQVAETGAGDALKSAAEEKAFKAAAGNRSKAYDNASARGVINEHGRELLDSGTVGFGDSAQQIADKAEMQRAATGKEIGSLLGKLDETAPNAVSGQKMADGLREYASKIGGSGNKSLVEQLGEAADDLEKEGDMSFQRAQVHKDSWTWDPGKSVTHEVARKVKGIIGDEMENAVGRIDQASAAKAMPAAQVGESLKTGTGPDIPAPEPGDAVSQAVGQAGQDLSPVEQKTLASTMRTELGKPDAPMQTPEPDKQQAIYQDLKSKYGTMAGASENAQITANRYAKNNSASLGDKTAAVAAAAIAPHAAAVKVGAGVLAGIANKTIRKRGNSAAAVGLDKIGDLLNGNPEALGKYAAPLQAAAAQGPQALAIAHYLMSQKDEGYQEATQGAKP